MSMSQTEWAARVAEIGQMAGWHEGRISLLSGLPPGYGILSWMEDAELCPAVILAIRQLAADWLAAEGVVAVRVCRWEYDEVNDSWDGTCGGVWKHAHIPSNDGPEYCPRCGGKIEVTQ